MKNNTPSIKKPSLILNKITVVGLDKTEMSAIWGGNQGTSVQSTRPECDVTNPITGTGVAQ